MTRPGKPLPKTKIFGLRDGLFEAILDKFYEDPTLIAYGEGQPRLGRSIRGLPRTHRSAALSPLLQRADIRGCYRRLGGRLRDVWRRAIVELMYADFIGCAGDEIFNQVAKWQSMSAGILKMPIIVRVSVGSKYGAQHSQDWTALCAHIRGLKVVFPASPYDAKD